MSSLLIVTSSYPFGLGESFFTTELEALAARFDRVAILPATARSNERRPVPGNVLVLKPLLTSKRQDLQNAMRSPIDAVRAVAELVPSRASFRDIANAVRLRAALSHRLDALAQMGCDLVYLYWGFPFSAMLPGFRSVARCVHRFHGSDLWGGSGGSALRAGVLAHMPQADKLFFVSEKGWLLARQKLQKNLQKRGHVHYLGSADLGKVSRRPYTDEISIISCAFIKENKRLDRIAKTVNTLSHSGPITWTHIGGGDDSEIAELRDLAGPDAKVQFSGSMPHEKVAETFHECRPNILMNMSDSEGLAVNVMEAMSANVPIISTDVGGMAEAVTDRVGILVEKGYFDDTDALANRVLSAIRPGGVLAEASPRSVWEDRFDARANARVFAEELRAMCDGKS